MLDIRYWILDIKIQNPASSIWDLQFLISKSFVQHLSHFSGQSIYCKGFLEIIHSLIKDTMVSNGVICIARQGSGSTRIRLYQTNEAIQRSQLPPMTNFS
jgi:hypothetical protein